MKGVVGNVMLWGNVIIMGEKLWGGTADLKLWAYCDP